MKVMRDIVKIDEELCNGCGECVPACAEGAIQIIDGKARLKAEKYCDGLGACLGNCPQGALTIIQEESDPFDEEAVHDMLAKENAVNPQPKARGGCPGSAQMVFTPKPATPSVQHETSASALTHWPVKLRLMNPQAPFLKGANLMITADCATVALAGFNPGYAAGHVIALACPKFEEAEANAAKLAEIIQANDLTSLVVVEMEVPCCQALDNVILAGVAHSGKTIALEKWVVSRTGEVIKKGPVGERHILG
ncbi:ATP-binding protein [Desulfovibrio inopinatus]|uniref:ATP-binding protein n=1 Tax=Desulfovibrio inopinatus TaxID=102109 RepID=UPI00040F5CAA|nr:4Fe-4S binding protein [Desulfovibrio inopinatus]